MYRVLYCLRDQHDWKLVLLAAAVCILSSFVATLTIERAQSSSGAQRMRWVLTAGAAISTQVPGLEVTLQMPGQDAGLSKVFLLGPG